MGHRRTHACVRVREVEGEEDTVCARERGKGKGGGRGRAGERGRERGNQGERGRGRGLGGKKTEGVRAKGRKRKREVGWAMCSKIGTQRKWGRAKEG